MTEMIRVYLDGNMKKVVGYVKLNTWLDLNNAPSYENEGAHMGIERIEEGRYKGRLAVIYYNEAWTSSSFAEIVSEVEAYDLCFERGKFNVIEKLEINPNKIYPPVVECVWE